MNILILGSMNTIFLYSYERLFKNNNCNVFIANTSPLYSSSESGIDLYEKNKAIKSNRLRTLFNFMKLDRINFLWSIFEKIEYGKSLSEEKEHELEYFIKKNNIDIVFCFWGTSLKKESLSLQKIKNRTGQNFKTVLCVNTYPTRYELPKDLDDKRLNILKKDSIYFDRFDGIICTCKKMDLLFKDVLHVKSKTHVSLDFLDNSFFSKSKNIDRIKNSLVFLGNVDFKNRSIDDVSSKILKLADNGINIWLQEPCNISHDNINTFKPFTYDEITEGKLSSFIKRFSASIVIYNDLDNLRTSTGYPTRFSLATLSQKTILIPRGVFDGIEEYVEDNSIKTVLAFKAYSDIPSLISKIDKEGFEDDETAFISSTKNELTLLQFLRNL